MSYQLLGKTPNKITKRLKMLIYGASGTGKTFFSLHFPAPYLIDTEKGAENDQYTDLIIKNEGAAYFTIDFDDLCNQILALLTNEHQYKTLIIDPLTHIYHSLIDKCEGKLGAKYGRHFAEANKHIKRLLNLLIRLDMNVIITSHAKREYLNDMVIAGDTYDCYKKLDYLFDLVIETKLDLQNNYMATIKKSRITSFTINETIALDYVLFSQRYGVEIIDKNHARIILASSEQVEQIKILISELHVQDYLVQGWLDRANATQLSDFTNEQADAIIKFLFKRKG